MLPLIKLFMVLAIMVGLIRLKVDVGVTLFICALILGMAFGMPFEEIGSSVFGAFTDLWTWELVAMVVLINCLGGILKHTEKINAIAESIEFFTRDIRVSLAAIPAFIGLLPMPGGALLSAPLAGEIGDKAGLSPEKKTIVNYWFRHVWEYMFPLYPGVIVSAGIFSVPISTIIWANIALTPVALLSGFALIMGGVKYRLAPDIKGGLASNSRLLIMSIWPVAAVIMAYALGLKLDIPYALVISLILVIGVLALQTRGFAGYRGELFKGSLKADIIFLLVAVMVFKAVVEDSSSVEQLPSIFDALGLPIPLVLFVVPAIVGLLTGITVGYVGSTFPLLAPIIAAEGFAPGYFMLAYVGGYMGVMASPVHLCLVLSRQYYGADMGKVYRMLLPLLAAMSLSAVLLSGVLF